MKVAEGDIDTKSQIGVLLNLAIVKGRYDQGLVLNPALVLFDPTTTRVSRSALSKPRPLDGSKVGVGTFQDQSSRLSVAKWCPDLRAPQQLATVSHESMAPMGPSRQNLF